MLKKMMAAILVFGCASAWASDYEDNTSNKSKNAVLLNLSFVQGGLAIGGDFENTFSSTFGLGGYARIYQKDKDEFWADGVNSIGAFIRPHFQRRNWDFYISPAFGIHMIDSAANDKKETALGPALFLGLLYKTQGPLSFGVEQTSLYGWFNETYRRGIISDLALKLRYQF